jgi:Family of unknown function (DUF5681)
MVFQPGQSGNPKGRPKELKDIVELARVYTPEALERLVDWMRSDDSTASVKACSVLLDRAWGKAEQPNTHANADGSPIIPVLQLTLTHRLVDGSGKKTTKVIDGKREPGTDD